MATVYDLGILAAFDFIFAFVFTFAVVLGILQKTKPLGDSIAVNSLIAAVSGFLLILVEPAVELLKVMVPWFIIAMIVLLLAMILFQIFGVGDDFIAEGAQGRALMWTIIVVAIITFLGSAVSVFGPTLNEARLNATQDSATLGIGSADTTDFTTNIVQIIFHPKILGVVMIFVIAIFSVIFLGIDSS